MTVVVVGTHTSIKGTSLYVKQLNVLNFQSASLHHSLPNVLIFLHLYKRHDSQTHAPIGKGVGYSNIFIHIRRFGSFYGGTNCEFQYIDIFSLTIMVISIRFRVFS